MEVLIIIIALLGLLALGFPVAFALGTMSCFLMIVSDLSLSMTANVLYNSLDNFVLVALPLYMFMSQILLKGEVGKDIFNFINAWVGHIPGGLAVAAVLSCAFFSAISGSSTATVVTVGVIAIPEMLRAGYEKSFVLGLMAAAGTLGILIPPSGAMIIYGAMTDESVGKLFMAGVIPGIILALLFVFYSIFVSHKKKFHKRARRTSWAEKWTETKNAFWGLWLPVIVIGGIYTGIFTPTEAAGVGVFYSFVLCVFIYSRLHLKDFVPIMSETLKLSSMIFMIMANAVLFGHVITLMQVPQNVVKFVTYHGIEAIHFVILLNLILIFMGDFLEIVSIMMITLPIIFPILHALNIDMIWFAVIFVVNMEFSLITPPIGLNLFVLMGITENTSMKEILRGAAPFMVIMLAVLILVIAFPSLSLWMPGHLK